MFLYALFSSCIYNNSSDCDLDYFWRKSQNIQPSNLNRCSRLNSTCFYSQNRSDELSQQDFVGSTEVTFMDLIDLDEVINTCNKTLRIHGKTLIYGFINVSYHGQTCLFPIVGPSPLPPICTTTNLLAKRVIHNTFYQNWARTFE